MAEEWRCECLLDDGSLLQVGTVQIRWSMESFLDNSRDSWSIRLGVMSLGRLDCQQLREDNPTDPRSLQSTSLYVAIWFMQPPGCNHRRFDDEQVLSVALEQ